MRFGPTTCISLVLLVLPGLVMAQERLSSPCAPPTKAAPEEIDRPAIGDRPPLIYPTALRDAGIEGVVRLRYVVCQDGLVDPASIALERASHMGFVPAAVWMLTRQRHRPATIRGRAVSQEVSLSRVIY
jgi:hypothetical protein